MYAIVNSIYQGRMETRVWKRLVQTDCIGQL